ncbi:MAG: 3'-5' exonuclease [Acidimicrobiales bacterium]
MATVAEALGTWPTRISQLERGLKHNTELASRYQLWLEGRSVCKPLDTDRSIILGRSRWRVQHTLSRQGVNVGFFKRSTVEPIGFAVVDLETTGLYPAKDRVVEVAVVHLDVDGRIVGEFCTLIDPHRDVGPTRIHGITAADVTGAPTFATAAAVLWQQLSGRVLVAHNARFDVGFLDAEFDRCGVQLPPPPVMCTMQLSSHYLHNLPARTLTACCASASVELSQHHSALDDARAAAQLLGQFRAAQPRLPDPWREALTEASSTEWTPAPPEDEFHPLTRTKQTARRTA